MSGIRGKNTTPERIVRSYLHKKGLRFRLDVRTLPGRPDIVLPKYGKVIFVHGCFWHKHECGKFVWPKTRRSFWREKLSSNAERDGRNKSALRRQGWSVITIWECRINDTTLEMVFEKIVS